MLCPHTHSPRPLCLRGNRICAPFVFTILRIAFPATPLFSQPYSLPGGVGGATVNGDASLSENAEVSRPRSSRATSHVCPMLVWFCFAFDQLFVGGPAG